MSNEVKLPKTYDEQIQILESHGCIVDDKDFCKDKLSVISYYRLSAYFLPYKNSDGYYINGTTFETIYNIYEFDRKLRRLIFSVLEELEVYLKSSIVYYHSFKYGPLGYMKASTFNKKHDEKNFKKVIKREISNNKNVLFVKHHIENYNSQFPLWVVSEIFTFGMLSYFYNDLTTSDQKELAKNVFGLNYLEVRSWMRCCTDLRNICAHYGRIYYRVFSATPAGLCEKCTESQRKRLFGALIMLKEFYPFKEKWDNEFIKDLENLIIEYSDYIDLHHMAFTNDWKEKLSNSI